MMKVDDFMLTLNRMKDMQRKRDLRAFRDDLVRLVVGMQWREMIQSMCVLGDAGHLVDGGVSDDVRAMPGFDEVHRPAVDIVDEWLGVQR